MSDQTVSNNRAPQAGRPALDPELTKCTCPKTNCEWHGRCMECVALHRQQNSDHIPFCLQFHFADRIKALASVIEMTTVPKNG